MTAARLGGALATAMVALLVAAPAATADGDPASDILLGQDVFFPYAPNGVSKPVQDALNTTVARARKRGFVVKVALVADPRDLGSVGQLFREPQRYADLLTQEIGLNAPHGDVGARPRVLAVLPGGLGGNNLGDNAGDALAGVLPPEDGGGDGLARTAVIAVGKLSSAAGLPIELPTLPEGGDRSDGGGGVPSFALFGAPVLVILLVVVALNARMARGKPSAGDAPLT